MAFNDAELRFQASLEDDASPGIDALVKKLQAAGASPTEIKMYLRAQDEATPHINRVRQMLRDVPREQTIRFNIASEHARAHLGALKRELSEPISVPLQFTDNLEHIGQRLFTFKSRYAVPMAGMIPGANMLYGVGMGAGVLGAAGAATDLLKKSVDINAELQQQNASLTQALKDNTAATQEMGRIMGMAGNSQFGRGDLTQADIIARQFNLPSFAGESRYMPQGVIPQAQNLAAVGQTSVSQAAQAIAGATQGYFRQLLPYGISIRQEDFSPGGRFAGKSYQEAIDQATKRFTGAAEEQAKTFTGMLQRFHNMFEDKILQPLGAFTFDQIGHQLQTMLGGGTQEGFQERISNFVNGAQEGLTKLWGLLQKGKDYFDVNIRTPLANILHDIVQVGSTFAKFFTGTMVGVLKTLGEALIAIARPIANLINSVPQLAQFFGVMKALSLLGFKDISGPFVNPLKDLAGLHFGALLRDLSGIPGALTKIGVALIVKGFVDAHTATKALNDQFPTMSDHMDDVNAKITKMSYGLHESATHMKELVANAAQGLPQSLGDNRRLNLSIDVGRAAAQLHQTTGMPEMQAVRMITAEMRRSGEYSTKAIRDFGTGLDEASSAAKELGFSFSDLQRIVTQYASVANPVGMGGPGGAAALMGLQSGVNKMDFSKGMNELYPTRDMFMSALLKSYGQPSAENVSTLLRHGQLNDIYNFRMPTGGQLGTFNRNETSLLQQYHTAINSDRQAQAIIRQAAPDINVPRTPIPGIRQFLGVTPGQYRSVRRDERTGDAQALGMDLGAGRATNLQIYDAINAKTQELQKNISGLTNKVSDYQQAQARLNLDIGKFQHVLQGQQRVIEDLSLSLQKYTFDTLHPLERQMTRLNETMAENQNVMSNAQYEQGKWADSLFIGEQKALDQLHALENYNKQLQLLQLIYQQIGGDLGTTIYDQGAEVKVAPLTNIGLAMAEQVAQRRQQIAQTRYDLNYGEKHYQVQQAQRTEFQRTERSFGQVLQHVKSSQGIIDATSRQAHALGNVQFGLQKQMFAVNQHIADQQDGITGLQLKLQALQQSKQMRNWQDDEYHLGRQVDITNRSISRRQQLMSSLQNILDSTQQGKTNFGKLFQDALDFTVGNSFTRMRKAVRDAFDTGMLGEGGPARKRFHELMGELDRAQQKAQQTSKEHWYQNRQTFKSVLIEALKAAGGIWTGSTERNVISIVQRQLRHIPGVGGALGSGTAGEIGALGLTAYMGISTLGAARVLGRTGLIRGGARLLQHLPGMDTHILPRVGRVAEMLAGARGARAEARLSRLSDRYGTDPSWFQQRRLNRAETIVADSRRAIEIARGLQTGESDIMTAAQFATRDPFRQAASRFRWIRRGRERIGGRLGGAIGGFGGGLVAGEPGALVGSFIGERKLGRYAEETTLREMGPEAIKVLQQINKKTADMQAFWLAHKPVRSPEELRQYEDDTLQNLKDSRKFLKEHLDVTKKLEGNLDTARQRLRIVSGENAPREVIDAAKNQVKAAEDNVRSARRAEATARSMRDRAVEFRASAEKMLHAAGEGGHAARDQSKAARKQADNVSEDHKNRARVAASEHSTAHSMREHVDRFKVHTHEFGAKVALFGTAIAAFEGIKNAIGKFFGVDPKKGPGHHIGVTTPDRGRPEEGVGAPHITETPHVGLVRRGARGIFRVVGHGQRAFFGYGGAEGIAGGDPTSELFAGASTTEAAVRAARAIRSAGGVKTAAGEHILSKYGEKYGTDKIAKRAFLRAAGSAGLDVAAGGTPIVGQIYDLYALNEILKHTALGRTMSGPGTQYDMQRHILGQIGHKILPSGIHAQTQNEQEFNQRRLRFATPDILQYLKVHQTTLAEMEKIYASGGKLPKMFNDYFLYQLTLSQDGAKKDLKTLTDHQSDVINKTTQHFKDRVTAHQTGLQNVNSTETDGYKTIYDTNDNWLNKIVSRVKKTKRDLGLTHDSGGASGGSAASDTGGSSPANTSAGATGGHYAAGGIAVAHAHELANQGGRLIKVGEEGPEMVVPLMPHRRDRAKQLVRQAQGIIGMANGGYVNPLGGDTITPERTDQGVDFALAPGNPIKAIGDAKISGVIPNWYKGQPFLWYQLLSGPRKGRYVFVAEQIANLAKIGSRVSAGDTIARYASTGTGIEMGWATAGGSTLAKSTSGYSEGDVTPAGSDFRAFLTSLGVPGDAGKTIPGLAAAANVPGAAAASFRLPRAPKGLLRSGPVGNLLYHWDVALRKRWSRHLNARASGSVDPTQFQGGGDAQANMKLGHQMAAQMGWTGAQWDALKNLWIGESGWQTTIGNKSSGAYGIPQSLPGSKMSANGADWRTNPATQIAWGLSYIKQRYGSPENAYSQWQGRSPHWYHDGAWHVGDNVPSVLQKGEMVLPKTLAQSVRQNVRGLSTQSMDGVSRKMLGFLESLVEKMTAVEKHLKNLNDKTDKNNTRDHLSQLNSELRLGRNQVAARQTRRENTTIHNLLGHDPTDGEGTVALVDHEKSLLRRRLRSSPLTRHDRQVATHVRNLANTARGLLHSAHTRHQRTLATTAVHATARAQRDVTAVRHAATRLHHRLATNRYITDAAHRGVNEHLIHSITGRRLTSQEARNYRTAAGARTHGHTPTGREQTKALHALRQELNKGLGKQEHHLAALRKEADKHTKEASRAVTRAAAAQGKKVDRQTGLVTHITAASSKVQEHAQKVTASVSDRADKNRQKAEATSDKRDRDFQKKALQHLENIANRDLSVNILNEAHGATLTTTTTRTRRRKR